MQAPSSTLNKGLSISNAWTSKSFPLSTLSNVEEAYLREYLIDELIDGILILSEQKKVLYTNENARKAFGQLTQDEPLQSPIPPEIWHICQLLIQSRQLFPNQNWLSEFDILTSTSATLHIRARWLKRDSLEQPCLLLTVEDRQKAVQDIVIEEAKQYGLTPREQQVWLLHRNNHTYKEIATELGIKPTTVKKHMRSIHAKRKGPSHDFEQ
ncbi:MAG: LuxR C-terminal-related transcriptional regulator [Cyanobacteria bacterium P01_D01_bin.44]